MSYVAKDRELREFIDAEYNRIPRLRRLLANLRRHKRLLEEFRNSSGSKPGGILGTAVRLEDRIDALILRIERKIEQLETLKLEYDLALHAAVFRAGDQEQAFRQHILDEQAGTGCCEVSLFFGKANRRYAALKSWSRTAAAAC